MRGYQRTIVIVLIVLLQGLLFTGLQRSTTGHVSFPLDDTYIHLQYAKQIALGNYFQYQPSEEPSSGATSFLYAHVLALGYAIGFRGDLFILWVYIVTFASVSFLLQNLYGIGKDLHSTLVANGSITLVMISGWLGWAFWSGMEIALFSALTAFTARMILKDDDTNPKLWFGFMLTALCRPEGALFLLIYLFLKACLSWKYNGGVQSWLQKLPLSAYIYCVVGLLLPPAVTAITTGSPSSNGLLAKWIFYHPLMTRQEQISRIITNLQELLLFLCGVPTLMNSLWDFVLPGAFVFAVIGFVFLLYQKNKRQPAILFFIPMCAAVFFIATIEVWHMHGFRYIAPFIPLVYLLALAAVERIVTFVFSQPRAAYWSVIAVCVIASLNYFPLWLMRYAEHATIISYKQKQTAEWINANIPDDSRIAINDDGALAYFGTSPVYDMIGLVTNHTAVAYRMGDAGTYENLTALPKEKHPQYAVVFDSWFEEMAKIYDIFYAPLVTFPDPFNIGYDKTVFRINWNYYEKEIFPRPYNVPDGWVLKDWIDVAHLDSEEEHDYEFYVKGDSFPKVPVGLRRNFGYQNEVQALWPQVKDARPFLIPLLRERGLLYDYDIVDSGRRIDQEERFYLHHLTPGDDLHLVMRTCEDMGNHAVYRYRFIVIINETYYDEIEVTGTPWNWTEVQIKIPGKWITEERASIRVMNIGSEHFDYYMSFYYWAYQPNDT